MKKLTVWLVILCLAVQLAVPLGASAADRPTYNIASLVTVARYMTGQISLTPEQIAHYDVDGNGRLNIVDLTRMALIIVGEAIPDPPGPSVSDQEAMDLALSLVPGAQQSDIREFKRDLKDGQLVYEVTIVYEGFEYDAVLSAQDGTFLEWGFEQITVTPGGEEDIGLEAARQIALDRVPGATEANITAFGKDTESGVPVYEGTILYGGREYDFTIHASTGTFVKWGYEVTDRAPAGPTAEPMPTERPTAVPTGASPVPAPTSSPQQLLTLAQAQEAALSHVPGATVADIVECQLDHEYGRPVYEGEIRVQDVRYVFDLDAYTGERLAWYMETRPQAGDPGVDIGVDQAKALAVAQVPGAAVADITECERHTEDGVLVYEVELSYGGFKYEFEIVASTGVICKSGFEILEWTAQPTTVPVPTQSAAPQPSAAATPSAAGFISVDRAREIALAQVPGATEQDVVRCQLDWEDGARVYEVEIVFDGVEHELEIDAATGVVLSHETDGEMGGSNPATEQLSWDVAKQLVLDRVPGAIAADFEEFGIHSTHGRRFFKGELRYDGVKYEFELDASSGKFLKWKRKRYAAPSSTPTGLISRDRAIEIALEVVQAERLNIRTFELTHWHGIPVYEMEIRVERFEYELRIDARNGDILKFERDD